MNGRTGACCSAIHAHAGSSSRAAAGASYLDNPGIVTIHVTPALSGAGIRGRRRGADTSRVGTRGMAGWRRRPGGARPRVYLFPSLFCAKWNTSRSTLNCLAKATLLKGS